MRFVLASVPEDPGELSRWLEGHVAGTHLPKLIDELTLLHGKTRSRVDLESVLGPDRRAVLERGLSALPTARLRLLLRNPNLLGDLQDAVIGSGSAYWDQRFDQPELSSIVGRARLGAADEEPLATPADHPSKTSIFRQPWFVALATAAAVLVAVYVAWPEATEPNWGWNKPGVLTDAKGQQEHLARLASAADEWQSQPKGTSDELRNSLQEMRDGCTKVLAARHSQLTPDDRRWLSEKCVAWGTRLDQHLADLQTGRSLEDVRREADETVEKLAQALRARSIT